MVMDQPSAFGDLLKQYRMARGLTQIALADWPIEPASASVVSVTLSAACIGRLRRRPYDNSPTPCASLPRSGPRPTLRYSDSAPSPRPFPACSPIARHLAPPALRGAPDVSPRVLLFRQAAHPLPHSLGGPMNLPCCRGIRDPPVRLVRLLGLSARASWAGQRRLCGAPDSAGDHAGRHRHWDR